jgi:hypothetical protein
MVHLAIAVQMCGLRHRTPTPAFLLGSIAPDAIHMRPDAGYTEKGWVHLWASPGLPDRERVRALLARYWDKTPELVDFAEGYAAHLLTDHSWRITILERLFEPIRQASTEEEQRALYYQDTDQIDFNLYHRMPWRPLVWEMLAAAQPVDFADFLTAHEIDQWRDRTLKWFGGLKQAARAIVECFGAWRGC